jgi:hypothetical protein
LENWISAITFLYPSHKTHISTSSHTESQVKSRWDSINLKYQYQAGVGMSLSEVLLSMGKLANVEKLKLIRILAEDWAAVEKIYPWEPFKTYDLPTPDHSFGVGSLLMQSLDSANR